MKHVNILFFLLSLLASKTMACTCFEIDIKTLEVDLFHEIFQGKIISITDFKPITNGSYGIEIGGEEITFEISKKWKGTSSKTIKIHQEFYPCSTEFTPNEEWIILTYRKNLPQFDTSHSKQKSSKKMYPVDMCAPIFKKGDRDFEKIKTRLNDLFPKEIQLKKEQPTPPKILIFGFILIAFILGVLFGKRKK